MKQIQSCTSNTSIAIVLVGNKSDVDNREVSNQEGIDLASEFNIKYYETSALNNINIDETFNHLTMEILRLKDIKDSTLSDVSKDNIELKRKSENNKNEKKCC